MSQKSPSHDVIPVKSVSQKSKSASKRGLKKKGNMRSSKAKRDDDIMNVSQQTALSADILLIQYIDK